MAAVKADAYGHGAIPVAKTVMKNGGDALGVSRLEEAIQLRKAGIRAPLLIFGYTPAKYAGTLIQYDLIQAVYGLNSASSLSRSAAGHNKPVRIHMKVDTGMGRVGLSSSPENKETALQNKASIDSMRDILEISRMPHLKLEGIFTHFATSDSAEKSYAQRQLHLFNTLLNELKASGLYNLTRHAANSAAIIDIPESHLDMVRAGIAVYGLYPSAEVNRTALDLKPAMKLASNIVQIKSVPAGFRVSYGSTWEAPAPTRIATVAVGYGDGYSRLLSNRGTMLVRGCRAPVVGRVCMDLTMIDVGHISDAAEEDEVVILGKQGSETISADEIASAIGTINYEIVTAISARVPRIYNT